MGFQVIVFLNFRAKSKKKKKTWHANSFIQAGAQDKQREAWEWCWKQPLESSSVCGRSEEVPLTTGLLMWGWCWWRQLLLLFAAFLGPTAPTVSSFPPPSPDVWPRNMNTWWSEEEISFTFTNKFIYYIQILRTVCIHSVYKHLHMYLHIH